MVLLDYLPIGIFITFASAFAILTLLLSAFVGKKEVTSQKVAPYECGIPPVGDARQRMSVRFYMVAMLFILFDIEVAFLYPWAVVFTDLRLSGLIEMVVFIAVLAMGFIYAWKRGGLKWE
jgi:NADH-quinone oxidoreductase subunit A